MDPTRGDSRYNLNYPMGGIGLSLADQADIYGGNPAAISAIGGGRPPSGGLIQPMGGGGGSSGGVVGFSSRSSGLMPNSTQCQSLISSAGNSTAGGGGGASHQRGLKRAGSDCYEDHNRSSSAGISSQSMQGIDCHQNAQQQQQQQQQQNQVTGNVPDVVDDSYTALQNKKSPPANGKKTKGRVKIKMEYIDNKLRRYTTFSKRKTGIMKKAYELSTLTGTQVMLLVASETGHVYTFATRKLQPMITSEAGKQLIQTCLNSPDPPSVGGGDQRMSATGFEETELSYNIADEDSKDGRSPLSSGNETDDSSDPESPGPALQTAKYNNLSDLNTPDSIKPQTTSSSTIPAATVAVVENINFAVAEDLSSTGGSSGETQPKHSVNAQHEKSNEAPKPAPPAESLSYTAASLSCLPQDVLMKLIQSGHLQLHTEEDGSGQQYVSIPLSTNAAQTLKSITNDKNHARTRNSSEAAEDMRFKDATKSSQQQHHHQTSKVSAANKDGAASGTSGLIIKQEIE